MGDVTPVIGCARCLSYEGHCDCSPVVDAPRGRAQIEVERLARWLYYHDADFLIREDWTADTEGLRDVYRDEAREALRIVDA